MHKKVLVLLTVLALMAAGCGEKGKKPAEEGTIVEETAEAVRQEEKVEQETQEEVTEEASVISEAVEENSHDLILQTLGGDDVAQVVVPEFLTHTEFATSYIKAGDDGDYEVTYMYYGTWDTDRFFNEIVNTNAYIDNDSFSSVVESEMQTTDVSGKSAQWKKISAVYEGDIGLLNYGAVVEVEGGVLGINFYAYDLPDADTEFFEILSGITIK